MAENSRLPKTEAGAAHSTKERSEPLNVTGGNRLQGATPSNTAPSISMAPKVGAALRYGIDSLYLSYKGSLKPEYENQLQRLKQLAQSKESEDLAHAKITIKDNELTVSGKGSGKYKYVLNNEPFRLSIASAATRSLPVAHCQISSHWLTIHGVKESEHQLYSIVSNIANDVELPQVSRVDLFVDFVPEFVIDC